MAFLDKLKQGLSKTKSAIFGQIDEVLKAFVRVDEDLLEELEELLITSDVGVNATEEIIDRLREAIKDGRLKEKEDVEGALREILDRIMNAERLLSTGKTSITSVATQCGFADPNYFSTVFKKLKGVTPLKFSKSAYNKEN